MKNWIKYTVVSISILLIIGNHLPQARGCAGGSIEDEYFSGMTFIQSDLSRDLLFLHYFYDANSYRSQLAIDKAILNTKRAQNLQEWERFFGKKQSRPDLEKLVYAMTAPELEQWLKNPAAAGLDLLSAANRPALEYLLFAKQCEPYVVAAESDWYYEADELRKRRPPEVMQKLIDRGLEGYRQVNAPFLKARYAYQVVRLANYAGFYQKCVDYYDQLLAPLGQSSIAAAWAWRLQNGALQKCGRPAEGLVQTALLFDQNRYLMDEAFVDFHIPPEPLWKQCLQIAGQKHRQATLWLLRGLREERLTLIPLQEMYRLEPQSSRLEMLLVRYVNRLEQDYSGSYLFFKPISQKTNEQKATALKYYRELQQFLATIDRGQVHDPVLWDCVAAYLQIVTQNYQEADRFLAKAASGQTKNNTVKKQVELLKVLNSIARNTTLTATLEAGLVKTLAGLEREPGNNFANLKEIHHSLYTLLAQKYLKVNDYVKGYCCLAKADYQEKFLLDYYPSNQELDSLLQFYVRKDKTTYEKLLTTGQPWKLDDLYSVKGTQLLRQENWKGANTYFNKITPAYWAKQKNPGDGYDSYYLIRTSFERNYYNPRTGLYQYPPQGFSAYTKLEFTRKIIQLEEQASRNPVKADLYYYQIANGCFHSPYWACNENIGESLLCSQWLDQESLQYYFNDESFAFQGFANRLRTKFSNLSQQVGVRKTALKYYVKAMQVSKNKEFAARCCFLAQACMTEFSHYRQFTETGKSRFAYFDLLRQRYANTAYYQNCLKECATLKKYLNQNGN